jgi:hypothetical protein
VKIFVKVEPLVYGKNHERCNISGQRLGYVIASMLVTQLKQYHESVLYSTRLPAFDHAACRICCRRLAKGASRTMESMSTSRGRRVQAIHSFCHRNGTSCDANLSECKFSSDRRITKSARTAARMRSHISTFLLCCQKAYVRKIRSPGIDKHASSE